MRTYLSYVISVVSQSTSTFHLQSIETELGDAPRGEESFNVK